MKKVVFFFIGIITLVLVCVYVFIPSTLMVGNIVTFHGTATGVTRALHTKETWNKIVQEEKHFMPSSTWSNNDFFTQGKDTFYFAGLLQNAINIDIRNRNNFLKSQLAVFAVPIDSVMLRWSYSVPTSANPITRLVQYKQAADTKKNMRVVLDNLKRFLSEDRNIYGSAIVQTSTQDTLLISTKSVTDVYPSTEYIYQLIGKLQKYAKEKDARQTGYPMMNVMQLDTGHYSIMVAIPLDKPLSDQNDIVHKQMIPGRFLTTTVTGGTGMVNNAYQQLQQYLQDYNRTAMAIPFMYLVTDRSREKDSSKWVTKLYFPVM